MTRGIYLVGFSGSGKSTIARAVGEKLRWPASDLDDVIAEQGGISISEIFLREGEEGFRLREAEALQRASMQSPFVIATGGGTFVRPENRKYMASKGWVICLEAQIETLLGRIQRQVKDSDPKAIRPLLGGSDPLDQIRSLKSARQSAYGLSDWTVHTDRLTEEQVVDEVIRAATILENSIDPTGSDRFDVAR